MPHPLTVAALPLVSFDALWHVGSLDPADKGEWSYEGSGLSVSLDPDEWVRIARLSGDDWELTRDGNAFLDYHALTGDQRAAISTCGLARGYVEERTVHVASRLDDELDTVLEHRFLDQGEALAEAAEDGAVTERVMLVATSAFPDPCVPAGEIHPHQVLTTLWVAAHTTLDGVWWQDILDPAVLSAPRGVIRVDMLPLWERRRA